LDSFYLGKTCKCGCENQIKIQRHHRWLGTPDYIKGHHMAQRLRGTGKWINNKICKSCNGSIYSLPLINCSLEQHRAYHDSLILYQKREREKLRLEVLNHYGGKCACCGFDDINKRIRHQSFLGIDHINGDGRKHIKSLHSRFYIWLRKNNYPVGFRILCHPCNIAMNIGENICELHKWELSL